MRFWKTNYDPNGYMYDKIIDKVKETATNVCMLSVGLIFGMQIFRKHQKLLGNLPKVKVTVLVHITFDAQNLCM